MSRRKARFAATSITAVGLAIVALVTVPATSSLAAAHPVAPSPRIVENPFLVGRGVMRVCGIKGVVASRCLAEVLTVRAGSKKILTTSTPEGYSPAILEKAYSLPKSTVGDRGTIAILDEGADPKLASDLSVYRSMFGLPPCTVANRCFAQYNEHGGAPLSPGTSAIVKQFDEQVAVETSLDVDMASAACPMCHIIEITVNRDIEATSDKAASDFGPAVNTAAKLGASSASISYQFAADGTLDLGHVAGDFYHPGMAITVSSGDQGWEATPDMWPQNLQTVTSVGGTSLYITGTNTFEETGWDFGGSGCANDLGAAIGQPASVASACSGDRTSTDVSADADPSTGVAVYDSYAPFTGDAPGWFVGGGTSISSPFVAGLYARGGHLSGVVGPNTLYADPSKDFNDIVAGSNYYPGACDPVVICRAGPGWDGPTGLGSPHGLGGF
jgi:subtilase family serine protease